MLSFLVRAAFPRCVPLVPEVLLIIPFSLALLSYEPSAPTGDGSSVGELGGVIGELLFPWERLLQSDAFHDQSSQGFSKVRSRFGNAIISFRAITIIIIYVTSDRPCSFCAVTLRLFEICSHFQLNMWDLV